MAVADRKFASVEMWPVRCCGDGIGPFHQVGGAFESNTTEYVSSAAGGPRFRDQGATLEPGFVRAEVIKDFVNDLGGYVNSDSIVLAGSGEL